MNDAPRWTLPASVALVTAVYLATCAHAVLGGDNGEFATLFAEGGVAHPSGYPLYTVWLRLWSWLPASSPAHGAALATALLGGCAAAALVFATRAWGASRLGALFALGTWAFASLPWRLSTHAEVFSLNAALALAITGLSSPDAPVKGTRRAMLLGLAAGAALANHMSSVLMAPLGLYGLYLGVKESDRKPLALAGSVLALVPGLSTYGYLYVTARHPEGRWIWGATETLSGLVHHALRSDYGTFNLSADSRRPDALGELWFLVKRSFIDLRVLPPLLGIAGFFALTREVGDRTRTVARGVYAATLVLAGPVFMMRFNIAPTGLGALIVERFHLMPEALLTAMAARGFDHLAERAPLGVRAQTTLAAAVAGLGLTLSLPEVGDDHEATIETYLLDTLDTLPPNAVVLGTGDHRTLGFPYVQRALGRRRDVLFIDPMLLPLAHYRARIEHALGRRFPFPVGPRIPTVRVAETILSTGRELYLADVFSPAIPRALPTYPYGTVIRVLPAGAVAPRPDQVIAANEALYQHYRLRPSRIPLPPWQAAAQADYARTWITLAGVAEAAHRPDVAGPLRARAALYTPTED